MEGVEGPQPNWNALSSPVHDKIIQQMAAFQLELGKIRFDRIGSIRTDSTTGHGASFIDILSDWRAIAVLSTLHLITTTVSRS